MSSSLSICALVDSTMRNADEIPVFARKGKGEIIDASAADLPFLVQELGDVRSAPTLSLLINSYGGMTRARVPIDAAMHRIRKFGGQTWAFTREFAESNAGWLFCQADRRVGTHYSDLMLHQETLFYEGEAGALTQVNPLSLKKNRKVFRGNLIDWLQKIPSEAERAVALQRAKESFASPNPLDEFRATAEDLDQWGMMEAVVKDEAELMQRFLEASQIPESILPASVRNFFDVSSL